jgi:hypothetical protein
MFTTCSSCERHIPSWTNFEPHLHLIRQVLHTPVLPPIPHSLINRHFAQYSKQNEHPPHAAGCTASSIASAKAFAFAATITRTWQSCESLDSAMWVIPTHECQQAKYNCSCGDNHKANTCSCTACHTILRNDDSPCSYYGRCVEPLAWNIEHEMIGNQTLSPLFITLPKELRDLIFEYALTDSKSYSLESLIYRNASRLRIQPHQSSTNDIAVNLLRTCRAIYLETWTLPLSLNPYIVYDLQFPARSGAKLHELLPWQLSLIQGLDITVQQTSLEGSSLRAYLHSEPSWQSGKRHKGGYITPRRYKTARGPRAMIEHPASFNFALVLAQDKSQPRHFLSHILGTNTLYPNNPDLHPPWASAMRVTLARPITHLTLRILHSDWWTWSDDPNSTNDLHHLGLDPTVGDGLDVPRAGRSGRIVLPSRPTASRMRKLADERRAGLHPKVVPGEGWADTIGQMPDLKRLELVLETFKVKARQLDSVVEAAKTWKFPIQGTQWELVWDGEVEMSGWSMGVKSDGGGSQAGQSGSGQRVREPAWHVQANEFEVRVVRFVRRRL